MFCHFHFDMLINDSHWTYSIMIDIALNSIPKRTFYHFRNIFQKFLCGQFIFVFEYKFANDFFKIFAIFL